MTRTRSVLTLAALATILNVCQMAAQQAKPTFEVASIRVRTGPGPATSVGGVATPGLFKRDAVTVQALVTYAFDLLPFEVAGGPDWIRTQRFEVVARMDLATTLAQQRQMVQSLLEDRFQLKAHREAREMRGFTLLSSSATKRGAFMKPTKDDCSEALPPLSNIPPKAASVSGCHTMPGIARWIARELSAPVVDETKVDGSFVFNMFYAPESVLAESSAPAFATALREQLGLQLEPRRVPVEILVIDSVSQPTEN